jgi:hypothetical protein
MFRWQEAEYQSVELNNVRSPFHHAATENDTGNYNKHVIELCRYSQFCLGPCLLAEGIGCTTLEAN